MEFISKKWKSNILILCLFGLIALVLLSPIASNLDIPNIPDLFNHLAGIMQAKLAFSEGQFPLRVAVSELNNWRYPFYQFYSTSGYTFAGLIYVLLSPGNPFIAYKIALWCAFVVGGIYIYRLAFYFLNSEPAAILASVSYMTAPYYIVLFNHMGGFNEALALGILPAVVFYTLKRFNEPSDLNLVITALTWYLLATIHLITFVYASFFINAFLLIIILRNPNEWKNWVRVFLGYFLGCLLACWYIVPILLFSKLLIISQTFNLASSMGYYHPNMLALLIPFIKSSTEIHTHSGATLIMVQAPSIGWPFLFGLLICLSIVFKKILKREKINIFFISLLIVFLMMLILICNPFNMWSVIPSLAIFQYSWRLLGQLMWVGALLFGWSLCYFFKNKLDERHVVIGIFVLLLLAGSWLPIQNFEFINVKKMINQSVLSNSVPSNYLLDEKKYLLLNNFIDNIALKTFIKKTPAGNRINLESSYNIPPYLVTSKLPFEIDIQGKVEGKTKSTDLKLLALINKTVVAAYTIKNGNLAWRIPLTNLRSLLKKQKLLNLQFKFNSAKKIVPVVKIDKVAIKGFINKSEVLSLEDVEKNCKQHQQVTVCNLYVPKNIKLIELPILYYHDMLNIKLNNHMINYKSILIYDRFAVALKPDAGKLNHIEIIFTGLAWANDISYLFWSVWIIFLIFILMKKISLVIHKGHDGSQLY